MAKAQAPAKNTGRTKVGVPARPFGGFGDIDRMFEGFFNDPFFASTSRGIRMPALSGDGAFTTPRVDVKETDKAIIISAELPGIDESDVDLTVKDDVVTLKGEKKYEKEKDEENVHVMERSYGAFQRSFRLPDSVDRDRIDAKFDKGVLTVTLPRKPSKAPSEKKIKIGG